jgi:hypothetical protein
MMDRSDDRLMRRARTSVELFLGLSAAAGVMAASLGTPAAIAQHHHPSSDHLDQGGEGGEGGEGTSATILSTDVDFLVVLGQMQGHLLVAEELLKAGDAKAAEPHVGHPVDELYGAIVPVLQERGVPSFLNTLEELRQQVRLDPASPLTMNKLMAAQQAIATAALAVPLAIRSNPDTVSAVVRKLAEAAAAEYSAAEADGQIVEVLEYQDARGFLLQAQQILKSSRDPSSAAAEQFKSIQLGLQAMLRAFPSVRPPAKAVVRASQLEAIEKTL